MSDSQMHAEIIELATNDGPMAMLHKQPAGDPPAGGWPVVVIFHDGPGIRNATHEFMEKLVVAGFRVATPDLYHRRGRLIGFEPAQVAAKPELRDELWGHLQSLTDEGIQHDLDVALAALDLPDGKKVGTIGFCLGARAVYRSITRMPDLFGAGAMWHPSFLTEEPNPPNESAATLTVPLFIGIGTADTMQSIEMHQPFFDEVESLEHVELAIFDGADHGYTWPGYASHHQLAADSSWEKTIALFVAHLT